MSVTYVQIGLFGEPDTVVERSDSKPKRKTTQPRGYAARPGTGPAGETCKSCDHYTHRKFSKTYRKCALNRAAWTRGPGSDIKAGSPACEKWERKS